MNYFAITVVLMQTAAAIQYARQGLYWEAGLWMTYGAGNIILMILAAKRLTTGN